MDTNNHNMESCDYLLTLMEGLGKMSGNFSRHVTDPRREVSKEADIEESEREENASTTRHRSQRAVQIERPIDTDVECSALDTLPVELVDHIMSFLDHQSVCNMSQVSRWFNARADLDYIVSFIFR